VRARTRGVDPVDNEFDDHPELSTSGFLHETPEILQRAEIGIDVAIVRNIVAVVAAGGGIERQQPERFVTMVATCVYRELRPY
jgi:hypothetical protein